MAKTRMSAEQRRQNILDAAMKVIAESNYYEATTAKIAAAAGITEPTIYLHFESKQQLFLDLLDDIRHHIISRFLELIGEGEDTVSRLRNLAKAHYEFIIHQGRGERFKVLTMATLVNDPDVKERLELIYNDLRNFFLEQLGKARSMNIIRDDLDPKAVTLMMISWLGLVGTLQMVGLEKTLTRKDFERAMDSMEMGLRKL